MSNFLRTVASSNHRLIITIVMLALLVLIGAADLIVPNSKMEASGIAQGRASHVREGIALSRVIRIEDIYNIDSPEFPKRFQIKIKNISSKPIYHISINVHLPDTEPFRLTGDIWFPLRFGHPKLVNSSLRLEDITESERKEHPLTPLEPGKSVLIGIDDKIAEYVRKQIETEFGSDNPATKRVESTVQVINFGDGTGYIIGQPYPSNRKIGFVSPKEPKIPALIVPSLKGLTAFSPKPTFSFFSFLPKSVSSFFYLNPTQFQPPFHYSKPAAVTLDYRTQLDV